MSRQANRRQFLQASAAAGVGYWVAGGVARAASKSPNEQIQIGACGVNGKGKSDVENASEGAQIYALCDVDRTFLNLTGIPYEVDEDRQFTDYREMFDKMGDKIDAVTISTPDHTHAVIASQAMKAGKHIYCQKPMTHSIYEARHLGNLAREMGVVTQMGNQFTCFNPMRRAAYQLRAGQVGTVDEVHIWTNRPVWPQGGDRPAAAPVPPTLDWEVWLGPAPYRDYGKDAYHQFAWRGWWDFGTGALGDMACHTVNMPFMALNMRDPTAVEAKTTGHNGDSYPPSSQIKFDFPELDGRAAFTMYWYDGGELPPTSLFADVTLKHKGRGGEELPPPCPSGVLVIGDRAKMYAAGDYAEKGIEIIGDVEEMDVDFPRATPPAKDQGHMNEWLQAIYDSSKTTTSNFPDYAGPLTETILLGNLAVSKAREPGVAARVEWDAKKLQPLSDPTLRQIVRRDYREGYVL